MQKVIFWMRRNLFSTWFNSILTAVLLYAIIKISASVFKWAILDANFIGHGPEACTGGGACWVFVRMRFNQFMYGFFPVDQQWRINLSYMIASVAVCFLFVANSKHKKWSAIFLLLPFPIIAYFLYKGGIFGLAKTETYLWGGLHLTLVVAVTGIVLSLPLGILLALGRRSTMPIVRWACIGFIELWRGVPLISVLFMASVMLPLFFPDNLNFDKLLRALIGITLFASAYMAEVVRAGLQALPLGQYEAARSLGIKYWTMMYLVILPQALKIVIPSIMNTFIGLFKDTTLILIIGLFDFLGMIQAANSDPKWLAYGIEGYIFAAFGYWIFCFSMSRFSINLEHKLKLRQSK